MERPNLGKQQPRVPPHSDAVHLVFPLRIIAPPGTQSRLPHPLDAFNSFNAFCSSQTQQSFKAQGCGASNNGAAEGPFTCSNGGFNHSTTEKKHPGRRVDSSPKRDVKSSLKRAHPASAQGFGGVSPRQAVINLLRIYHGICRNMLYEEEIKAKESCRRHSNEEEMAGKEISIKGTYYLKAGSIINKRGMGLNRENNSKVVGSVAGVEVGDHFYFRMELCCIGMHTFLQSGIDYISSKSSQCDVSIAISIISSGSYNDTDNGEVLIYTGQGGRSALDRKPTEDQKMERGNLALENSMKRNVPVRVFRGVKDGVSPTGKIYTYDGLYKIEDCWSEKGKLGFGEFKFKLQRIPGQPTLGSARLKLSNTLDQSQREGLLISDVSSGKEAKPVCVVNTVDNIAALPHFDYVTVLDLSDARTFHNNGYSQGCNCVGECKADQSCSCFSQNGNMFAYMHNGILVKERGLIYECGIDCKCSASCWNRLTHRPQAYRLEVFKTDDRGWGLRSWDTIPAGSFICEYTGKLVENAQAVHSADYVLNLNSLPNTSPPWGHVSEYLESQFSKGIEVNMSKPELLIDSSRMGNAARFINHSCSPNVLVQCVLRNYTRCPLAMLFAMDNIPPFTELTIDFGCNSNIHTRKKCLCKSVDCKGTFCG